MHDAEPDRGDAEPPSGMPDIDPSSEMPDIDPLSRMPDVAALADRIDPEDLDDLRDMARRLPEAPYLRPVLAEMRERLVVNAEVGDRLERRHRERARRSRTTMLALRLDTDERHALERRAAYLNVGPTVLARNYIRVGLQRSVGHDIADLLAQLETTVARLREQLAQPGHRI